jgi:hypothetical protein
MSLTPDFKGGLDIAISADISAFFQKITFCQLKEQLPCYLGYIS